jgi:hypothetical protein
MRLSSGFNLSDDKVVHKIDEVLVSRREEKEDYEAEVQSFGRPNQEDKEK